MPESGSPPPRDLPAAAEAVLREGWREGRRRDGLPYAFTRPSAPRLVHQWYWDSCFHAIVWRHFDLRRARAELRTLLRSRRPDGFIPHTVFWHQGPRWRRAPLYATLKTWGEWRTSSIQTPLIALAWETVARASHDDPGFATEALTELKRHYDWLDRERDPDGDGLITIIHPDESGLDDSPKYKPVFGWMTHDRPGYWWLIERARRMGYDSRAIIERYPEHVEDVLVNVFYALSLRALSRLLHEGPDGTYATRAVRTERALLERCYDPGTGLFFDLAGPEERPIRISTWSALAPLALTNLPTDVRRRIVEEHLLNPRRYLAPYGIPSVSMEEPEFNPRFDMFFCWRGPSWVNTAWLLVPPMRELGYHEEADRVVDSLARAAAGHGFREYYNPFTGEGLGGHGFGWSTLLVDLVRPDRPLRPAPSFTVWRPRPILEGAS